MSDIRRVVKTAKDAGGLFASYIGSRMGGGGGGGRGSVPGMPEITRAANRLRAAQKIINRVGKIRVRRTNRQYLTETSGRFPNDPKKNMVIRHGSQMQMSKDFIRKVRQAVSSVNTYQLVTPSAILSPIGQCIYSFTTLNQCSDLLAIAALIPSTNNTQKYTLLDSEVDCNITNQSSGQAYLRVYEVIPRHDCPGALGNVLAPLYQGFTDTGYAANSTNINSTAFQSPQFTTWYKILKVRTIEFAPGQNMKLTLKDLKSRVINLEHLQTTAYLAGVMRSFVFQQWGQAVNDSVTKTNVSTDATKFDFVFTSRYHYTYTPDTTNTVTNAGTLGTVNVAEYIQPLTGAVITDTEA